MTNKFEEKYFVGSKESNYTDYRIKKFDGLAEDLIEELNMRPIDRIVDFGCATGALMHSLKCKGYYGVSGTDIGIWPINYGRETFGFDYRQLQHYNLNLLNEPKDWVMMLDVLEHCPDSELDRILGVLSDNLPKKGLVVRIPVSKHEGEDFVLDVSKNDRTHIQIHDKDWWTDLIETTGLIHRMRLSRNNIYDSDGVFCAWFAPGGTK